MQYGMIGYFVPFNLYPPGYHTKKSEPLPFMALASQKNYIALYHMALYAHPDLLQWFTDEYAKTGNKLDMGKGCIRFKKIDQIPYSLLGELAKKISVKTYVATYENIIKRH